MYINRAIKLNRIKILSSNGYFKEVNIQKSMWFYLIFHLEKAQL